MKKQEIMDRLIVKPKKMVVGEGVCAVKGNAAIYSNAVDTDLSFLLSLAGYENDVHELCPENVGNAYVLLIGTNVCPELTQDWKNEEDVITNGG